MKKMVSFSREIPFKTRIAEVTDIEVTHDLRKTLDNTIEGNFIVNGKYRMTDASQIEEDFSNEIPFIIDFDDKYDLNDISIKISDFFFEIIDEDVLKVNIEVEVDNIIEKEEVVIDDRCYDEEEKKDNVDNLEKKEEEVEIIEPIDILDKEISKELDVKLESNANITDVFTSINTEEDNFSAYYVYIVRENDTIDDILLKYNVGRESLSEYNDLDNIKVGSKLIIPSLNNE